MSIKSQKLKKMNLKRLAIPFARHDDSDDEIFFRSPCYEAHIDIPCRKVLERLYLTMLPPRGKILDLMAGFHSHLPREVVYQDVIGLGLNEAELKANSQLSSYIVRNLNRDPILPFEDACFDACILSLSVQYLSRPAEIFADVARVLRPCAPFVVAFSDRMYPTKSTSIWRSASKSERLELVRSYMNYTERFDVVHYQDLSPAVAISDPIYIVSAYRNRNIALFSRSNWERSNVGRRLVLSVMGAVLVAACGEEGGHAVDTSSQTSQQEDTTTVNVQNDASNDAGQNDTSNVDKQVRIVVSEQLGVRESDVRLNSHFTRDLGADSLDTVELVMAFEEEFEIEIPDEDAEKIDTLEKAISYIKERIE